MDKWRKQMLPFGDLTVSVNTCESSFQLTLLMTRSWMWGKGASELAKLTFFFAVDIKGESLLPYVSLQSLLLNVIIYS